MSHVTTHVLDTMTGKPAAGIAITLYAHESEWMEIAKGQTDADGRIRDLLPDGELLPPGMYKLKFLTKAYFDERSVDTFYPFVEITFIVTTGLHYHVPLLLNPFGYTTYRGS